jgi:putative tricarboxylic transport membrane protein
MTQPIRRAAPYLAIVAGAVFFYIVASGIEFDGAGTGRIGPEVWPKIILVLLIATAGFGVAKALFGPERLDDGFASSITQDKAETGPAEAWPQLTLAGIALFVAYAVLLEPLGFIVATALLLGLFMLVGRYRNYKLILATSLGGSLLFFFIFKKVVYLSLPLGKGPFLTATLTLMKLMGMS